MWEFRRDFQRVWEGWEAGFMAFHAFHTLSFPWPAFSPGRCSILQLHRPMSPTRDFATVIWPHLEQPAYPLFTEGLGGQENEGGAIRADSTGA